MHWGHKITISFILFGAFIITLVVVCVRTDFYLVAPDYYQQTLDYETHITQAKNAQALVIQPELIYTAATRQLELVFPTDVSSSMVEGEVVFFRPSNANQDFEARLILDADGRQTVDLTSRQKGLWKVELSWKDSKKEYYMEQKIFL